MGSNINARALGTYRQCSVIVWNIKLIMNKPDAFWILLLAHIVFADIANELLGFIHSSRSWSKHRERFFIHLTYSDTFRGNKKTKLNTSAHPNVISARLPEYLSELAVCVGYILLGRQSALFEMQAPVHFLPEPSAH